VTISPAACVAGSHGSRASRWGPAENTLHVGTQSKKVEWAEEITVTGF